MSYDQDSHRAIKEYNDYYKDYMPQRATNYYYHYSSSNYSSPQRSRTTQSTSNYSMLGYVVTNTSGNNKSGIE